MARVRITPTIANEYATRCPEHIPEHVRWAGTHEVTPDQLHAILDDAAFNCDPQAQTVGPYAMPLPVFNAYRALKRQCEQLTQSVNIPLAQTHAERVNTGTDSPQGTDAMTTAKTTTAKKPRAVTARTQNSRIAAGSGVYRCRCCTRNTRATGRGDNDMIDLCSECYDLCGNENHMNDNGGALYDRPADILAWIADVAKKGGNAAVWDHLKAAAEQALAPVALPPGPFAAMDAKGTAHAHTDAAHAVALVESTGSGWVAEFHGATACLKWAYEGGEWWLLDAYGKNLHQQKPT